MMLQHLQTGEDLLAIADNDGDNEAQMERERDHFQFGLHCCCLDAESKEELKHSNSTS